MTTATAPTARVVASARPPTPHPLGVALLVVSAVAGALTLWLPDLLSGTAAMNGSARGTALVVLVVAAPLGAAGLWRMAAGSARALLVWLGAAGYLLYNALMFVFATPLNELFLLYVAMLSLAVWSVVATLSRVDVDAFGALVSPRLPVRGLALYVWVVVGLNTLAWLRPILAATLDGDPQRALDGTGLTTNPVWVQDLAFWLPLAAVSALWLRRRRPWGYLLVGSLLTLWVLESLGIAVDQWMGHAADPSSSVASSTMAVVFAVLAGVGLVPLASFFRNVTAS